MNLSNLANVPKIVVKAAGHTGLILRKASPEILLVVGIGGGIVSTVLACKATLKVEGVLENHQDKVDKINRGWEAVKRGDIPEEEYSEKDYKKDLTVAYTQTVVDFIRLYGPAATLGVASIACVVGGHNIMSKRNVALVAAYKAVEEGFSAYRKRVVEDEGEEKDYIYKNGLKVEEVVENEIDDKGKTTEVTKTKLKVEDPNNVSGYARFFDEGCAQWTKNPEYNLMYLRSQQNYFNDMLKARGHVFLNEIYDALGIPRSKAGSVVGWVLGNGDSFIDFGIFDGDREKVRDFVNGYERSILLDFNVDGVIYDLI